MPINVTIADIITLRQDAIEVRTFIEEMVGQHKEAEAASQRLEDFMNTLTGMDVNFQV